MVRQVARKYLWRGNFKEDDIKREDNFKRVPEMLSRASKMAGFCKHGNEPSGSIQGEDFLTG